jgi:hypothetical protein
MRLCLFLLVQQSVSQKYWVQSLNTRDDGQRKLTDCLLLLDLSTGRHLLDVSLVTSKSNLRTAVTTYNTMIKCFITSTKPNYTSAQRILTGIHRLLVTNRERSAFSRASNCQGRLQIPHLVSIGSKHPSRL